MSKRFAVMRDLQDHLIAGRISLFDLGVYTVIQWQADFKTGIWWGSALKIHATAPRSFHLRQVQLSIKKLSDIGFLRRFLKKGRKGNYPVLINKYQPLSGALKSFRLNATKSIDWERPMYEPCTDNGTDQTPIQDTEGSTEPKPKAKPRAAKPAPPPDTRFQPIVDSYYQEARRVGLEPTSDVSDFGALSGWLRKNPKRSLESIVASLRNAFNSTDHYPLQCGFRLREFLKHEMKYQLGPLLKAGPRPIQSSPPRANELSPAGSRKLEVYGVAR